MGPTVRTKYGTVRGRLRAGVACYLGIPYAASPTGRLRFQAPAPPEPWAGIRDAVAFGPTPPKPSYPPPFDEILAEPDIVGDDWLNLNVWAPEDGPGDLPVMVWIHGGAFANGNSAIPLYDGHAFARDGVVFVSLNYRLGVDGFAALPDAPANRGLLDQVAALEWVKDNVGPFGGDPANVTIFGESAGAMSVITLLSMPRADGLFARAIAHSGAAQAAASPADAALVTAELGRAIANIRGAVSSASGDPVAGTGLTARELADVEIPDLLAAHSAVRDALSANPDPARFGPSIVASTMPFIPVIDGDCLPDHPLTSIVRGAGSELPLMIGTNRDEFRAFLVPSGMARLINEDVLTTISAAAGATEEVIGAYRASRPGASPADVLAALLTDRFFRLPALAIAEARADGPAPTYVHEFAWRHPMVGAGHGLDVPFVFDNLGAEGADVITGRDAPAELAEEMHDAWVRFAKEGDPGWPAYDARCPVRIFENGSLIVQYDPRRDERMIWAESTGQDQSSAA